MKLIELLNKVKDEIISDRYQKFSDRMIELYPAPDVYTPEEVENHYVWHIPHFISLLSKEPKDCEGMSIKISYVYEDNSEYEWDDEEWFDVSGFKENDESSYALEFTDWDQWLDMEVLDASGKNLSDLDMFIHCLWEMTFLGGEDESGEVLDDLKKQIEDVKSGKSETFTIEELKEKLESNLNED